MSATATKNASVMKDRADVAADELAQAEQRLAALRTERDGLAGKRRDAASRADSAALLTLTKRVDEIATEVSVAEIAVLAARLVYMEAKLPAAEEEYRAAVADVGPLLERSQAAELAFKQAQSHAAGANEDRRYLKVEIGNLRRQMADAVAASGRDPGTIMRYRVNRG